MRKSVLLLLAVLIALPAANAIGQPGPTLNVAIIKCVENNTAGTPITVFAIDTTIPASSLPATCTVGTAHSCAACLRDLAHDFQCRGGSTFTSNTEAVQQSSPTVPGSQSINKFVFACGPTAP
jgi:hypothetical protein